MQMDTVLPDWLEKGVESSLRDSEDDKPPAPVPTAISPLVREQGALLLLLC